MQYKLRRLTLSVVVLCATLMAIHGSASAKDQWIQVKSKNFFLIGNASEKDIKRVATRLEQFREVFRNLFKGAKLSSSVPTNVVVFKDAGSYQPFKPRRGDGKADTGIAGYFQPGPDVNYITLSTEREDAETFGTVFHEYVHFIMDTNYGKSDVPIWFNEGLAEYYQTFAIEEDIKVKLGLAQAEHLDLLQNSKFIPLDQLFNATHHQVHGSGGNTRSMFYSQSWALVHYLIQTGKADGLARFISLLISEKKPDAAFKEAFQMDYAAMEKELRKYVSQSSYKYQLIEFKNKLTFENDMQLTPLDEATANAYLGDLLFHSHRPDDAEPYLATSLKLNADLSLANTAMGMVKLRQRKWAEAKTYLEKAMASDARNHIALYRYAYLLSREGRDEFGISKPFEPETTAKMRDALKKAIAIEPTFTESYDLLAYISMVSNEGLDEALQMLQTAQKHQPGNQGYALRIAEIYFRQNKFDEAERIAEKIARTADDDDMRKRAAQVLSNLDQRRQFEQQVADAKKQFEAAVNNRRPVSGPSGPPRSTRRESEAEQAIRAINGALRPMAAGHERAVGRVEKVDCWTKPVVYTVRADGGSFKLTSMDFDEIDVSVYDTSLGTATVACDADLSKLNALITWDPSVTVKNGRGKLVALEFVPAGFRLMSAEELANPPEVEVEVETATAPSPASMPPPQVIRVTEGGRPDDASMREMMIARIREALRKPAAGEKREMGYLEKFECKGKDAFLHFKTTAGALRLRMPAQPMIRGFTPDMEGIQFTCNMKPVDLPVVFVFTDKADQKAKIMGEIVSMEFVPKSFTLE